jgi:hypothetical protein
MELGARAYDPTCKEFGIAMLMLRETKGSTAALHVGYAGTLDKTVAGTFIGGIPLGPEGPPFRSSSRVGALRYFEAVVALHGFCYFSRSLAGSGTLPIGFGVGTPANPQAGRHRGWFCASRRSSK